MNKAQTSNELDQLVIRLERNHQCILRLASKLNSYKYEPKNYEGFLRLRDLRSGFKNLAEDHAAAFDDLQHNGEYQYDAQEKANTLLERYQELEKAMAAYILDLQFNP